MSVIHFDSTDLGAVALSCVMGSVASDHGKRALRTYSEKLARISTANAAAHNASYGDGAEAWTADEIESMAQAQVTSSNRAAGKQQAAGLRYNLVANNGTDFAGPVALDLCDVLSAALR
jgi:hypothetical protein